MACVCSPQCHFQLESKLRCYLDPLAAQRLRWDKILYFVNDRTSSQKENGSPWAVQLDLAGLLLNRGCRLGASSSTAGCCTLSSSYTGTHTQTHTQMHRTAYTTCVWLRWCLCAYVECLCVGGCEGGWVERLPWHSVLGVGLPHMCGRGRGGGDEGSLVGGKANSGEGLCWTLAGSSSVRDENSQGLAAGPLWGNSLIFWPHERACP